MRIKLALVRKVLLCPVNGKCGSTVASLCHQLLEKGRFSDETRWDAKRLLVCSARMSKVRKATTVRFDEEDLEVIRKLRELTRIRSTAQLIRSSLRAVLRKLEAEVQKGWN